MKGLKTVLLRIHQMRSLKYVVVITLAVALVGFVDENSVWNHFSNKRRIALLQSEIQRYTEQYQRANMQLYQLEHSPKGIEKIARERYFMKTDDEDIFVLSDDVPASQPTTESDDETTE